MEKKTHWKQLLNPDYLGAYSLQPGEVLTLTIKDVVVKEVVGNKGKKTKCRVMSFVEPQKPMILNSTNANIITKIYGSPHIEDWKGKKVRIHAEIVEAFDDQVEALRVRYEQVALPVLTKEMKAYQAAVQHLIDGGKLSDIELRFVLTDEIKESLTNDAI